MLFKRSVFRFQFAMLRVINCCYEQAEFRQDDCTSQKTYLNKIIKKLFYSMFLKISFKLKKYQLCLVNLKIFQVYFHLLIHFEIHLMFLHLYNAITYRRILSNFIFSICLIIYLFLIHLSNHPFKLVNNWMIKQLLWIRCFISRFFYLLFINLLDDWIKK